jgi:hypothetical protein
MPKAQNISPPALPFAPEEYSRTYNDQYDRVLRIYFTNLQSVVTQLSATDIIPATTNYLVADLPSAAVSGSGARAFVTDALSPTFGATVAGGGAVPTPVYSDGAVWKVG